MKLHILELNYILMKLVQDLNKFHTNITSAKGYEISIDDYNQELERFIRILEELKIKDD